MSDSYPIQYPMAGVFIVTPAEVATGYYALPNGKKWFDSRVTYVLKFHGIFVYVTKSTRNRTLDCDFSFNEFIHYNW